jgi:hypothetical protein
MAKFVFGPIDYPMLHSFDCSLQDLTGQITILPRPGEPYAWWIGAGASSDVFKGWWRPQEVTEFLSSGCHLYLTNGALT